MAITIGLKNRLEEFRPRRLSILRVLPTPRFRRAYSIPERLQVVIVLGRWAGASETHVMTLRDRSKVNEMEPFERRLRYTAP